MAPSSFKSAYLDTPLGPMIAMADEAYLHLLEFADCRSKIESIPGSSSPLLSIEEELNLYFAGKLREFKTPLSLTGTLFQKKAWAQLQQIPYGQTISYSDQAVRIGHPTATRAVAQANSVNRFAIVIPCHRVIRANGALSGYAGGVLRKQGLLDHEKRVLLANSAM